MNFKKVLAGLSAVTMMISASASNLPMLKSSKPSFTANAKDVTTPDISINIADVVQGNVTAPEVQVTEDGWKYCLYEEYASIKGYEGKETELVIPDAIDGLSVTTISDYAFEDMAYITSVKIPDSVTKINSYAFKGCKRLTSIDLGKSVTNLGNYIFSGCLSLKEVTIPAAVTHAEYALTQSSVETVTFAEGIANIPGYICYQTTSLKNIVMPEIAEGAEKYAIEEHAFYYTSVSSVSFPETLTSIGRCAFEGCALITEVTIPDKVTSLGSYSFKNCKRISSFKIGSSVATLGNYMLDGCVSLKEAYIPKSVVEAEYAFYGSGIESITFEEGIAAIPEAICYNAPYLKNVTIPEKEDVVDGYSIKNYAFQSTAITEIKLPESLTSIGTAAFEGCSLLTGVVIPDNVTRINSYAFKNCKRIAEFKIGKSVEFIDDYVFDGCASLKEVTIPASIKETGDTFANSSIESITFEEGIPYVPAYICRNARYLKNVTLPEKEDTLDGYAIGTAAFEGTAITSIKLPESLTAINDYAFRNCSLLKEAVITDNVRIIGDYAFDGCTSLEKITFGKSLQTLEDYFISGCVLITDITIPKTIRDASYAFAGSSVESVVFEEGIANIPASIFREAKYLSSVTLPEKEDTLDGYVIGDYAFVGTALTSVKLPESLTSIGDGAFSGCALLKEVKITDNVRNVGDYAFDGCTSLEKITFGNSVQTIGDYVVRGCQLITDITIPKSVKNASYAFAESYVEKAVFEEGIANIPAGVLRNTKNLQTVIIPEKEDTLDGYIIGDYAFANSAISYIKLPDSLTAINYAAFMECPNLETISLPDNIRSIGDYCFSGCKNLSAIYFSKSLQTIGDYCFRNCEEIKTMTIPSTVKNARYAFAESCAETLIFADNTVTVPYGIAIGNTHLKKVYLPEGAKTIEDYAFSGCINLEEIKSDRESIQFYPYSFENCDKLLDSRFSLMDRENTYLIANSEQTGVNGTINYTLKYKIRSDIAAKCDNISVRLSIPSGMTLILDSVQSKGLEFDTTDLEDGVINLNEKEGEIKFTARVTEIGDYDVAARLNFRYNGNTWNESIGKLDVECPDITIASPSSVDEFLVDVYGMAQKDADVEIYVNDEYSTTIKSNRYTGKYKGTVKLPEGKNGDVYTLYAVCGETKSNITETVYSTADPTVKKVIMRYGNLSLDSTGKDITDVLMSGTSPVISFNPANPLSFEITVTNLEKVDRVFVTSTKAGIMKYMEAFYNEERGTWVASGYFDEKNHSYVPGTLNISIIEKKSLILDENYDYEKDQKLENVSQAYIDNSSVEIVEQVGNGFVADVTVSDGNNGGTFRMYNNQDQAGMYIGGVYYDRATIAQNPEKYGFVKSQVQTITGGQTSTYYTRHVDNDDSRDSILAAGSEMFSTMEGLLTGEAYLEIIEGEDADNPIVSLANAYITEAAGDVMEDIFGEGFGNICDGLSLASDVCTYADQLIMADGNGEYMAAATVLFGLKAFNTFGTEAVLAACQIYPPLSTLISWGIDCALDSVEEYLEYCMKNGEEFTFAGYIRFIIDPSGIVFEAVITNPVTGAKMSIYYKDPETGKAVLWNAEDYDQQSTLYTDFEGKYAWDVPEGMWQVKCEMEGYETVYSEWLPVPPVQTEVNFGIVSKAAPVIKSYEIKNGKLIVTFSKYMDAATVTEETVGLTAGNDAVAFDIEAEYDTEGDKYADTYVLSLEEGSFDKLSNITLTCSDECKSYSGAAMAEVKVAVKGETPSDTTTTTTGATTTTTTKAATTTTTTKATTTTTTTKATTTTTTKATTTTTTTKATTTTTTTKATTTTTTTKSTTTTTTKATTTTTTTKATTTTTTKATTTTTTTTTIPTTTTIITTTATTTTAPPTTTEPVLELGDVNQDGRVDSSDASTVLIEYALIQTGINSWLTDEQKVAADVNKDGTVDATDASRILVYYAEISIGKKPSWD